MAIAALASLIAYVLIGCVMTWPECGPHLLLVILCVWALVGVWCLRASAPARDGWD